MVSIAVVGTALDYRYVPFRKLWTAKLPGMVGVSLRTAESAPFLRRRGPVSGCTLSCDMGACAARFGRVARASTTAHGDAIRRFRERYGLARRGPVCDHLVHPVDCAVFDLPL